MNKIKRVLSNLFIFLVTFMSNIIIVSADSGLDSNYKDDSLVGVLIEAFMNIFSFIGKLIVTKPGEEDYTICHIITSVICIIIFYIFTCVYIFKLDKRKKNSKEVIKLLLISLIPTFIYTLLCLLTKLQLIIYIFILILYIIVFIIIINNMIKNKIKKQLDELKNIDKKFNEEEFDNETFNIYKDVQVAWCDFKLNDIKTIISSELYDKYKEKLEELKKNNQKNIMSDIEFKSNKIVYINIDNNIEKIICEMNVICHDYIVENDKVIKGDKDKKYNYTYRLFFSKNIKNKKYILEDKKLLKIKIIKK